VHFSVLLVDRPGDFGLASLAYLRVVLVGELMTVAFSTRKRQGPEVLEWIGFCFSGTLPSLLR
jgi:hypothetical protein